MAIPTARKFVDALVRARFVSANDLNSITKITIVVDSKHLDDIVHVDVERVGDESLINAVDEFKED